MLSSVALLMLLSTPALEPAPFGPVPSARQLAWHRMERYAFVHFGPNTFTGKEWGKGTERPEVFNPTRLDCRQWVRAFKAGGFEGVILTAKHHDGFCLWPSKLSTHTVKESAWRGGKGDVLRELSDACRAEGLKMGVYLSPWDRNHPSYGTPAYNDVFVGMLREVLSGYGPMFEVWFDGANGEGPNGTRQVYDWPRFVATVRELQPNAAIFSDAGPDVRWVGNENGFAGETNWATLRRDEFFPGTPRYAELTEGHRDGTHWVPAECDVSIRPGWFWRASENAVVKSVDDLMTIERASVWRGASLLLNVPPNADGLISDVDSERLVQFRRAREAEIGHPIPPRTITATDAFSTEHGARALLRPGERTSWVAGAGIRKGEVRLDFGHEVTIDRLRLEEPIWLGQRVDRFSVAGETADGARIDLVKGTSIGPRRIVAFPPTRLKALTITIESDRSEPALHRVVALSAAK